MLFFLFLCYRWRESYLSITLWGEKSKITKHCHFLFLTIWYIYDGSAFFRMLSLLSFWIHKNSHSLGKCKFSIEKLRFPVYCLTQHFIRTAVLTENLMKRLFLMISALSDGANIWADIYHDPKRLSLQVASVSEAACDIMCLKFSCYFIRLSHCCEGIWALFTALLEFIEVCSHCTSIRFGSTFWFGHCSQSVVELLLCLDSSSYCMTPALAVGQVTPQAFIQSRQVKTNQVTYCNWCSPISVLDYLTISLREFVFFLFFFNIGKYLNHSTREMDKTDLINSH